jgi:hypothetical protein
MARRTKTASHSIVRYRAAPKPTIIRVNAGSKKKQHRRSGGGASNTKNRMMGGAIGGFAVGIIEKQFPNLPTLPVVGKKGAIALGIYFFNKGKKGILGDIGFAAACLAGYEFGTTGKVSGELARQVSGAGGLASQV